jgi:hypothetical protein
MLNTSCAQDRLVEFTLPGRTGEWVDLVTVSPHDLALYEVIGKFEIDFHYFNIEDGWTQQNNKNLTF